MSPTDFIWTVAPGSLLASSVATPDPSLVIASIAFASIFLLRFLSLFLRKQFDWFADVTQNEPLFLMDGDEILDENLSAAKVTRDDLMAKLREANVYDFSQVLAVVMETTGDICVIHSSEPEAAIDPSLVAVIRRSV